MNLNANWVLQIDPVVYKFLKKIPRGDAERILIEINNLRNNPFYGNIQKMKDEENVWRRRIGVYRIRYELIVKEKLIHIFRVERRTLKTY